MASAHGVAVASSKVVVCVVVLVLLVLAPSASAQQGFVRFYLYDARCRDTTPTVVFPGAGCYLILPINGYKFVAGRSTCVFYSQPGCNERDRLGTSIVDTDCFPPGIGSIKILQPSLTEVLNVPPLSDA